MIGMVRGTVVVALLLALGACSNVKQQLGLTKNSPDEFRVVSRAPLTVPPNFGLRPPQPGAARPQTGSPTEQARRTVFGLDGNDAGPNEALPEDGRSAGERALLAAAGVAGADTNIRTVIDAETNRINAENEDLLDYLVFWKDKPPDGVLVDPDAEAHRLQENATLGRGATEGQTPTIQRKKEAFFENIF